MNQPKWHIFNFVYQAARNILLATILSLLGIAPSFSSAIPSIGENAEEVIVQFSVNDLGYTIIPAVFAGTDIYLPIPDIFDFLKIKFNVSHSNTKISGFFLERENTYEISLDPAHVRLGEQRFDVDRSDFIRTETNVYMKSPLFGEIFGLNCQFNFRDLNVVLDTELDVPAIQLMRREKARKNLKQIFQPKTVDHYVGLKPTLFAPGMLDWAITSHTFSEDKSYLDYNMGLGLEIVGGGLSTYIRHDSRRPLSPQDVDWAWHYVNNDNKLFKQVSLGNVAVPTELNIDEQFQGINVKSQSTLQRTDYSTHVISDYIEPNWVVELYVKDRLVDFTRTDETGYYEFRIPLRYGDNDIKLKFYGPWGEEIVKESHIDVPHMMLPPGETDVSLTLARSNFSHYDMGLLAVQRGLTQNITSGVEVQHLDGMGPESIQNMSAYTSMRISNNLLISARMVSFGKLSLQSDLYTNSGFGWRFAYHKQSLNEIFNRERITEELSASLNVPHRLFGLPGRSYVTVSDTKYDRDRRFNAAVNFSASIGKFHPHIASQWVWQGDGLERLFSAHTNFAFSYKLPFSVRLRPMVSYDFRFERFKQVRIDLERPFFKNGWIAAVFNRDFLKQFSAQINVRYDFPLTRAHAAVKHHSAGNEFIHSMSGSVAYVNETRELLSSRRKMLNSGGITIIPFLDLNGNEVYDNNEPKVANLEVRTSGGRVIYAEGDTAIYILDLPEHTKQYVEFSDRNFESIAWTPKYKSVAISVESFKFKTFHLPIIIRGELSGRILSKEGENGVSGIKVIVEKLDGTFKTSLLSSYGGYFDYMGLKPGQYRVYVDRAQLQQLNLEAIPFEQEFTIRPLMNGDYVSDVEFVVQ